MFVVEGHHQVSVLNTMMVIFLGSIRKKSILTEYIELRNLSLKKDLIILLQSG